MIIQIGPYPPKIGGISIAIKRLKDRLDSLQIPNQIWNTNSSGAPDPDIISIIPKNLIKLLISCVRAETVHFHLSVINSEKKFFGLQASDKLFIIINNTLLKFKEKILTVHGDASNLYVSANNATEILNSFDLVICVKRGDKKYLEDQGVTAPICEIPAFIPPVENTSEIDEIPQYVWDFIKRKDFIISANATNLELHNNEDLYGADLFIDLAARMKSDYPNAGFILCLSNISNKEYYEELNSRIGNNFLFLTGSYQFYPILIKSSLFIRPTNTDGDAISIREAFNYGIPVLASDVVGRPLGTVLFKNRDIEDLYIRTKELIKSFPAKRVAPSYRKSENGINRLLDVYGIQSIEKLFLFLINLIQLAPVFFYQFEEFAQIM